MEFFYSIICVLFGFIATAAAQNKGSSCKLRDDQGGGTCTLFYKCSDPNRSRLKICSFDRNTPVVCCPSQFAQSMRPPSRPSNNTPPPTGKRVSERKCREYADRVTKYVSAVPLQVDPDLVIHEVPQCDFTNLPFIVGGEEVRLGEFPHMVALGFGRPGNYQFNCGGSLVSDKFVLTAAHCMSRESPAIARLGEHNLESDDDGADPVDFPISDVIINPDYRPPQKYNDIALVKLRDRVNFTPRIRPACLPKSSPPPNSKTVATGWGRIQYAEATSPVLLRVTLPVIESETCARLWSSSVTTQSLPRGIDIRTMLCAGNLEGGKDSCQGDSGGPLSTVNSQNLCVHYVVGVTSFGKYCGFPRSPGIYTRVSHFVPWIESIVWPGE